MKLRDLVGIIWLAVMCIIIGMWLGGNLFSSSPSGTDSVSRDAGSVLYISTSELQRRLNKQYSEAKLAVDGDCGDQTQFWWDRAYGDQIAIELWPE